MCLLHDRMCTRHACTVWSRVKINFFKLSINLTVVLRKPYNCRMFISLIRNLICIYRILYNANSIFSVSVVQRMIDTVMIHTYVPHVATAHVYICAPHVLYMLYINMNNHCVCNSLYFDIENKLSAEWKENMNNWLLFVFDSQHLSFSFRSTNYTR